MKRSRILLSTFILLLITAVPLGDFKCPEDGSDGFFTGKTRTSVSGKLMKQYKCYLYGHLVWVAD